MLTRLATALLIGAGLTIAIPATASAAGCTGVCSAAHGVVVIPGSTTPGNPGNTNPGNTGPNLGCPNVGIVIGCNPGVAAPAVPVHIPTIDVAMNAAAQEPLPTPVLNWAPAPRTYVALSTSFWVPPADFRTISATARVADQAVTATATPHTVAWNLVETTISCNNAGSRNGTGCAYTFHRSSADQPGSKFHITATITWAITWACVGNCDAAGGVLPAMTRVGAADLAVGEIQTQSTPG